MPRSSLSLQRDGLLPMRHRTPDRDPLAAYLGMLRPSSQRSQLEALEVIAQVVTQGACSAGTLPWEHWRARHTEMVVGWLGRKYRPATVERHLGALRGVLREAWCLRLMDAEAYYRAAHLPSRSGAPQRALAPGELRALLSACAADPGPAGRRDAALVWLLFRTGLRAGEVVGLDQSQLDTTRWELVWEPAVPGPRGRRVLLSSGARAALAAWLPARRVEHPALLQVVDGVGVMGRRLISRQLPQIVRTRMAAARLTRSGILTAYLGSPRRRTGVTAGGGGRVRGDDGPR
ncbi:MAG TPA: hypothetical protein VMW47_12405 [Verrucomicrobiae bacterium]|nr:hypothetical protein [Verrucomicrobiae bacterium]